VVGFYFIAVRPENKRRKDVETMRRELTVGDEVTTIGGIAGVVCQIKDNMITIETGADRVRIQLARWAVSTKGFQATEEAQKGKKEKKDKKADK
jgi:preprotein translocase subunit YajC